MSSLNVECFNIILPNLAMPIDSFYMNINFLMVLAPYQTTLQCNCLPECVECFYRGLGKSEGLYSMVSKMGASSLVYDNLSRTTHIPQRTMLWLKGFALDILYHFYPLSMCVSECDECFKRSPGKHKSLYWEAFNMCRTATMEQLTTPAP
jgi:hypothetical protein